MQKLTLNKLFTAMALTATLGLAGCFGDSEEANSATPAMENNAADVKQPEPSAEAKQALQPEPSAVEEVVSKTEEKVETAVESTQETVKNAAETAQEKVTDVKEAVTEKVASATSGISGQKAYSTCIGCHGANGGGGVGPQLNNQTVENIVAKLEQYKAGEQVGPMTSMMAPQAMGLSTAEMKAIGEYITAK